MYLKTSALVKYLTTLIMVLMISLMAMVSVGASSIIVSWPLLMVGGGSINLSAIMDPVSILFSLTVALISGAVFIFSYEYMAPQKFFMRFHALLFMFVLSMLFLIMSPNLIFSMLGWDGLGVTSYLLVIYYNNNKSNSAGMVTALVNRFGDFMLIMSISVLLSCSMDNIMFYKWWVDSPLLWLLLVVGAFTKSAQIPFSAWLPAAMAAPTPVSSLVHSSTLVTAGVYLLVRHLEGISAFMAPAVFFVGVATMTMASLSALNEKDMKKMVALSTLSQLGLMMMSAGMIWPLMAFMHLIIHAFFKALMFMSTGNMIHFNANYQSLMKAGGFIFSSPVNMSVIMVCSLSLMGAPFAAAFFSKEPLLEMAVKTESSPIMVFFSLLSVLLTGAYSMRFVGMVLSFNSKNMALIHIKEANLFSVAPISIMFFPAFLGGSAVSSALLWHPVAFLYPLSIKMFVLLMVAAAFMAFALLDSSFFFKKMEFSVFSMWSLSGWTSSMLVEMAHSLSKKALASQADTVNSPLAAGVVGSHTLTATFSMMGQSMANIFSSFLSILVVILITK